jgi:nucleotide-binding universal stress UspA family protein
VISSILVPLDGSHVAARCVGPATWLASKLQARLHVLSAMPRAMPARDVLARLHIDEEHWPLVELHHAPAYSEASIIDAIATHGAELVVMTARPIEEPENAPGDLSQLLGHVTQAVLEHCGVPVLLLPPGYSDHVPWERVLVPLSGGVESDDALAFAVRLGAAIDLTVHVAHVAPQRAEEDALAAQARYSDALHHEYRDRLEELVLRATPTISRDQCRRIRSAALSSGDVVQELCRRIEADRINVLVVGWHGELASGRARILKQLISTVQTPVLLMRSAARKPFRLEVGEAFE